MFRLLEFVDQLLSTTLAFFAKQAQQLLQVVSDLMLAFNGLANAFHIAAINGGRHVAPLFAGNTVFAWSEVLAASELPGRDDVGALRLRTVATKDHPCADFPLKSGSEDDPAVLLDLDYWVLMPR